MSTTAQAPETGKAPLEKPVAVCDVVMKGGITSGVIYPKALRLLGTHYRLQGLGGASAGAIGAALGAAAEYGRANDGFDKLDQLPQKLSDGKLGDLFQAQPKTRKLLGLMLTAAGADGRPIAKGPRKVLRAIVKVLTSFSIAAIIGAIPGAVCIVIGLTKGGLAGWFLFVAGLLLAVIGSLALAVFRLYHVFTIDLPANGFGICSGLSTAVGKPGFTDWLATQIDAIAGLQAVDGPPGPPLTFGHLLNPQGASPNDDKIIDLRLITTCLNEGKPYEMPFEARRFFFKTSEWKLLFPKNVVDALISAPPSQVPSDGSREAELTKAQKKWEWETKQAEANGLARLPGPEHLPVIVAARMSLSFPLLIAAIPLYTIDRHDAVNQQAAQNFEHPEATLKFSKVWFTDGGFCSNFPVDLFDSALPRHPTFAINLGKFAEGQQPHPDDPIQDVKWAKSNSSHLLPQFSEIPTSGVGAVAGFASAAFNTARNWHDTTYLNQPGHRDRIVRVDQTKLEGGLNLHMSGPAIAELARRGEAAAQAMYDQFNKPQKAYHNATGWDNHRWVRYRALLSVLPDWLRTFAAGYAVLKPPAELPSYPFNKDCAALAEDLTGHLRAMATSIDNASAAADDDKIVNGLTDKPNPPSALRRIPRI